MLKSFLRSSQVRAHSRVTQALLLYNNSRLPVAARVRVLSSNCGSREVAASAPEHKMDSAAGIFPCHFCSSLIKAPRHTAPTAPPAVQTGFPASTDGRPAPPGTPGTLRAALPSCVKCLCVDNSLRSSEPFFQHPEKAAAEAACAAAAAALQMTQVGEARH